ncbi:unnamed protein product [Diamesa hyperborea]
MSENVVIKILGYTWEPSSVHSPPPFNAVSAGHDSDGTPIFVGRALEGFTTIPAKVMPSKQACYVSFNGQEIFKPSFEYLVGEGFEWVGSSSGHVPDNAVLSGNEQTGEPLYVGRAHHDGSLTPGKIHQSHQCIYIAYGGMEIAIRDYDVLIAPQRAQWIACTAHSEAPPGAILAGNDIDGTEMFVGRALYQGEQIPAKVIPSKNIGYVPWGGQEIPVHEFEVLCNGNVEWVQSSNGMVLPNAVPGGVSSSGEILYIGRGWWHGALTPGKIQPSHGSLYMPFGGMEVALKEYEILIEN